MVYFGVHLDWFKSERVLFFYFDLNACFPGDHHDNGQFQYYAYVFHGVVLVYYNKKVKLL